MTFYEEWQRQTDSWMAAQTDLLTTTGCSASELNACLNLFKMQYQVDWTWVDLVRAWGFGVIDWKPSDQTFFAWREGITPAEGKAAFLALNRVQPK